MQGPEEPNRLTFQHDSKVKSEIKKKEKTNKHINYNNTRDREQFKIQTLVSNGLNIQKFSDQNGIFNGVSQEDLLNSFLSGDHSFDDLNSVKSFSGEQSLHITAQSYKDAANLKSNVHPKKWKYSDEIEPLAVNMNKSAENRWNKLDSSTQLDQNQFSSPLFK